MRLEVWKALFGEVLPQALSIFPVGNPSNTTLPIAPFSDATEQQLASFKATAWKVTTAALLPQINEGGRRRKAAVTAPEDADDSQDKFSLIVHQLLKMLESTSAATVCGGARALRCIAEARAHAVHSSGDEYAEDPRITDLLAVRSLSCLRHPCAGACAYAEAKCCTKCCTLSKVLQLVCYIYRQLRSMHG